MHPVPGQTARVVRVVRVADEAVFFSVKLIEFFHCANPKYSLAIFIECPNLVIAEAIWILVIVFISRKPIPVILIQAIPCSKPHHSLVVLQNRKNRTLRKPVVNCQVRKRYLVSRLSCRR